MSRFLDGLQTILNVPGMSRGQLTGIGFVLFLLGVAMFAGTYVLALNVVALREQAVDVQTRSRQVCTERLQALGLQVTAEGEVGDDLVATFPSDLKQPELRLGEASAAALVCPGWRMSRFCMGECDGTPSRIELRLRPV